MTTSRNLRTARPAAPRSGVSLIEIIVVVAIIGILASIGVARIAAPNARLFANDVKGLLEQARYEAVRRHTPVAVVWNGSAFETRFQASNAFTLGTVCTDGTLLRTHGAEDYRSVSVGGALATAAGGVIWLPNGLVRACNGSTLSDATPTRVDIGALTVRVWSGGAVTGP